MRRIRRSNSIYLPVAIAALLAFWCVTAVSQATVVGPLATASEAYNNGLGPDSGTWRGSQSLESTIPISIYDFNVTVDFAVFAPGGNFQTFLDDEFGGGTYTDPSGGSDYVYAFQYRNDGDAADEGLVRIKTGFDPNSDWGSWGGPYILAGTGTASGPDVMVFEGSSANWSWNSSTVTEGNTTNILYYTSSLGPQPDQLTVRSAVGSNANSGLDFASPAIPEPASGSILIIGVSAGLSIGRLIRRRGD